MQYAANIRSVQQYSVGVAEKSVEEHQGRVNDISICGQESNQTTWRLAKMNLAIRGIDNSQVKWNNEGSFLNEPTKT